VPDVDPWFARVAEVAATLDPNDLGPNPELTRRLMAQAAQGEYTAPAAKVTNAEAPGPHGPVPIRIYEPLDSADDRPLFVWSHGGAWLGGDLDMPEADATAREVCTRANATVVSVDYRLCQNGVHYPVPHDDVVAAYRWARDTIGGNGVTLGGASAGANLAAGACLRLRDDDDPLPALLMLLYPALHRAMPAPSPELADKIAQLPSSQAFPPLVWQTLVENYLGAPVSEADPYALPGDADLRGLPPTVVINCEYDALRASGEAFFRALVDAEVECTQMCVGDVLHGHINSPWLPQAQQSFADMAAAIIRTCTSGGSSRK
jgi:acetyl esterase/lipase